jgi:ClpP class serine protease
VGGPPQKKRALRSAAPGDIDNIRRTLDQDPLAPIYAVIDSPGGDPFEAMRCYRALRAHKAPIQAHVPSRCMSAALLVLGGADV